MSEQEISQIVWDVVSESASRGPGWAQEGFVLRTIGERLGDRHHGQLDLATQQAILHAWHDLFVNGTLAWGYDLDNPGSPFFHVRQKIGVCRDVLWGKSTAPNDDSGFRRAN